MKTKGLICGMAAAVAASGTLAFAAPATREDGSGIAIAIFLAFCALIVIGQLLPIFRTKKVEEEATEVETAKADGAEDGEGM